MADRTWNADTVGDWYVAGNWTTTPPDPNTYPQSGDTITIPSGTVSVSATDRTFGPITDETIVLGGATGSGTPVALQATSAAFTRVSLSVVDGVGGFADPLNATLLTRGKSSFAGQISVEPHGGSLTIDGEAEDDKRGNLTLESSGSASGQGGLVYVTQESALHLKGTRITNDALIQVEGTADIAAGLRVVGSGVIEVDNGGRLSVAGSVGRGQEIALPDGSGTLSLAQPDRVRGIIGLAQYGGTRIDLPTVKAQSVGLNAGDLDLYDGPNQTGVILARLPVALIQSESLQILPADQQTLTAQDFTLSDNGQGGTRITYTPQGPTYLEASLPVPIVASAGSLVSLSSILLQSFGTSSPGFFGMTLLPTVTPSSPTDYWGQPPNRKAVAPEWYVNGQVITTPTAVQPGDDVELLVGNNIHDPAQIQMQVTPGAAGTDAEYVAYDAWTTDPVVEQNVLNAGMVLGKPTPADIVAAASAYNSVYPGVLNSVLCNWIGDDVAAAAGVPLPQPNAQLDPSLNVEGGFWRVIYRGSASTTPVQNWGAIVQPGDIVRMAWNNGGGHTTTVLGAVNANGEITVYDNDDKNSQGEHIIGEHEASYWTGTDPAGITIYRLDPNQQYLIQGTALGEFIQGSTFDNLIRPGGGADVITAGTASNVIQDTAAHLNGIVITDFHAGDTLDFTDLDPSKTVVSYGDDSSGTPTLQVLSAGKQVAEVTLPSLPSSDYFIVGSDSNGGALVGLASVGTNASIGLGFIGGSAGVTVAGVSEFEGAGTPPSASDSAELASILRSQGISGPNDLIPSNVEPTTGPQMPLAGVVMPDLVAAATGVAVAQTDTWHGAVYLP